MFVTKLKIAAVMFLAVGITAGSVLTYARTAAPEARSASEESPQKPAGAEKKNADPITVKVIAPKKGGMMLMVSRSAQVVAAQQQQVVPLVSGTVKEVRADIGDRVHRADTLITLDAPLLVKEREQAERAYKIAQMEVEEARARVDMAQAEMKAASAIHQVKKAEIAVAAGTKAKWDAEVKRLDREVKKGIVDPQVLQESQAQVAVAEAQIKAAEAAALSAEAEAQIKKGKFACAKSALEIAVIAVGSAQNAVEKAHIQWDFTQLKAAFDGVVTRRTIDAGNFVQPSDSRLLRPLLVIQRTNTMRIVFRVVGSHAPLIKRGMAVGVGIANLGRREYKISRFSPSIEESFMTVEIDAPNADNVLLPGMAAEVELPLEKTSPDNLIVPRACFVEQYQNGAGVIYVVRDGKAYRKTVRIGSLDNRNVEIIEGIKASDLVVTNPGGWADGTPVKIEKTP